MELSPLLAGERLVRRYPGRTVVEVDRIAVHRNEVLAVLGPNGAGKSTLFRILSLLERADSGRVLLEGREVRAGDTRSLRRLAPVFQRPHLFSGTVESNVGYALRVRGARGAGLRKAVAEALEWLDLGRLAAANVATLSGGEVQRVALARALIARPDVLLLDEPTANLDVDARRRFREDLERIVRRAAAAILITHDATEAFALADRVVVMESGRIAQEGTPMDIALAPSTSFTAALSGAELLVDGTVTSAEPGLVTVQIGAGLLVAGADRTPAFASGQRVHVSYRPEDVVIAPPEQAGATSAINRFVLSVSALVPAGPLVRVRLTGGPELTALVTRRSTEQLGLAVGTKVVAQLKATALRAFPAAETGS